MTDCICDASLPLAKCRDCSDVAIFLKVIWPSHEGSTNVGEGLAFR